MMSHQETREFQTEVRQLLDIVINSLYTEREIFLRELISNAADALEKVRYLQVTGTELKDSKLPLEITIEASNIEHTLTIQDTGIGMTKDELIQNLGTIAHSGSKEFIKRLSEGDSKDLHLIGQFGVGFYSAFMVAEKVKVYTRSYHPEGQGWIWTSDGGGSYTIEEAEDLPRGTKVVLYLKPDAHDFANVLTVKRIIRQYSSFVPFPIYVDGEKVNVVEALWTKNKSEIKPEDYNEFYKFFTNAYDDPLYTLHFSSDAPISIHALLFVPKQNIERLGFSRLEPGVNVYCKKVMIQEQSHDILPEWLRFLRGVVDSEELPLNISRETMQDSALVAKLNKLVTTRFLKFLAEEAKNNKEKYREFWEEFGFFIKEGAATDFTHRNELIKLLRYESSKEKPGELVSLDDYVKRMPESQKEIYYANGPSREAVENGPYMEVFKKKDIEVLYTKEAIDDYILNFLGEYEGKKLVSIDQANINVESEEPAAEGGLSEAELQELTKWLKDTLDPKVTDVRPSKRLVDSPAIILCNHGSYSMQRMYQMVKKELNPVAPGIMEINPNHKLIKGLNALRKSDEAFAKDVALQLLENAQIAAGLIVDPREMVDRLNAILERAVAAAGQ